MTQVIRDNKTISELQEEPDYEWKDGDDTALYDSGYHDGINKCIEILKNVAAQPELNMLPSSFTVSVVLATMNKILDGED